MKISVLGTGMVGNAIGTRLLALGHEVMMGSRTATNEKAKAWVASAGNKASNGTYETAAAFADKFVINCGNGQHTLDILKQAGASNLKGKILIDIANPLDFSEGMPPFLSVCNKDSLGEQVQKLLPETKVIKSLNTLNCNFMLNPALLAGDHVIFMSGNDDAAKGEYLAFLNTCGWKSTQVFDLGDIKTARGTEMLLPVWLSIYQKLGTPNFNFGIVK